MTTPARAQAPMDDVAAHLPPSTRAVAQQEPMVDYTVEARDTLIGLGNTLLVNPQAWGEVARINRLPNPNLIYPQQVLAIPVRLLRSAGTPAVLESVTGQVQLDGQPVTSGQTIRPGQRLTTGPASSVLLRLGDGSRVSLAPQGETVLTEHRLDYRANGGQYTLKAGTQANGSTSGGAFASAMQLIRGTLDLVVSKVNRSKPLEVTTPTAVIGVRGTQYRIHADEGQATRTEVLEGRVRADPLNQAQQGKDVNGGYGAALPMGKPPTVVELLPPPPMDTLPTRFAQSDVRIVLPGERLPLRAQVAADPRFENLVRDERIPPGGDILFDDLDDGRWYLRLRRIDALGIEGKDGVMAFTLKSLLPPPAAVAPEAERKVPAGKVTLRWGPTPRAVRYQIEVARDTLFKALSWRQTALQGNEAVIQLPEPGEYYWHMASVNANGELGPWSAARRFLVRPLPAAPRGELRLDGGFDLVWPALPEDRHQVELASDAEFTQVVARTELGNRRWPLPTPETSGPLYFRFRSVEPDGFVTPWSPTLRIDADTNSLQPWRFTVTERRP